MSLVLTMAVLNYGARSRHRRTEPEGEEEEEEEDNLVGIAAEVLGFVALSRGRGLRIPDYP